MTPAPDGVTEIESEGAGTQQTNNSLATMPCGLAVSLGEKYVCFWPGGKRNMLLLFFIFFSSFQLARIRIHSIINHSQYLPTSNKPS